MAADVHARTGLEAHGHILGHAIVELAAKIDADITVVGGHTRRGLSRFLVRSVAEKVTRAAGCAVLVVRPKRQRAAAARRELERAATA